MFTKIWNWVIGVEHSVETIVADITSTVKKLEQHATDKWRKADIHAAASAEAEAARAAAATEAVKAEAVAKKLGALVS